MGAKHNWTLALSVTSFPILYFYTSFFPILYFISIFKIIFPIHVLIPHSPFLVLETSTMVLHGTIRNDDFWRSTARQCWNNVVTIRNNVATMLQRCVALKMVVANRLACLSPLSNWTTATATRTLANDKQTTTLHVHLFFFGKFCCTNTTWNYSWNYLIPIFFAWT